VLLLGVDDDDDALDEEGAGTRGAPPPPKVDAMSSFNKASEKVVEAHSSPIHRLAVRARR